MINATTSATTTAASTSRASIANNFETFLTLLTAQLRNQDPLSPLDSKDFTNQLVQFSGVEQQLKTNELLEGLTATNRLSAGATAVAYLGREATANTSLTRIEAGQETSWNYDLPRNAGAVTLRVLDSSGRLVATAAGQTTRGDKTFTWDGKDQSGRPVPAGEYRLEVNASAADGQTINASISRRGLISAVDLSGATPTVTIGGASVPLSAIVRIGVAS